MAKLITQAELKEVLDYDRETGVFRWKISRGTRAHGSVAGYTDPRGYCKIKIGTKLYYSHRLAWFYIHGRWPENEIDHINGDPTDNRIKNLRDVPASVNQRNAARRIDNTSGVTGVEWCKAAGKWIVRIYIKPGQRQYLGVFGSKNSAISARREAEVKYKYSERHGKGEAKRHGK